MLRAGRTSTTRGITAAVASLDRWNPLTASNVNSVVLGFSRDPNAKVTVLLFWPGSAAPWAVAKLPTTPEARAAIERESSFLDDVHQMFSGDVMHTIPQRLMAFESGMPIGAMVAQAFRGIPLSTIYSGRRHLQSPLAVGRDVAYVGGWLRGLQTATVQSVGPICLGEELLDGVSDRHGGDALTPRVLSALAPLARNFKAFRGPKTVVHGDFWLGNILIGDSGVTAVIDWESAELCGEPLRDVARFAITYALYLDRRTRPGHRVAGHDVKAGEWGAGVAYLMTGRGWFPEAIRDFMRRSMVQLGADPACWPALLLFGLADVAAMADDDTWAYRHLVLLDRLKDYAS
jgi:hypothetical protein